MPLVLFHIHLTVIPTLDMCSFIQWNLRIMKELGQPIFSLFGGFFIERYKSIEEYANGTLEKFHHERFFTIRGVLLEVPLYVCITELL